MKIELFDTTEFYERNNKIKKIMASRDIDVLLLASPANQFYATGYDGCSYYTPQIVIISLDRDEPIWFGRRMDAIGAKMTTFMDKPESIVEYADEYVSSNDLHPISALIDLIKEKHWDKKRIGIELDSYYYTAKWHALLTKGLPDCHFIDATLLVNWVRLKKSPREIEYMFRAGKIATQAMADAYNVAAPGVRQCDVIAALNYRVTAGTDSYGGTFACKPPNAMADSMCAAPHLSWTDEKLKEGSIFYIEMGGVQHRYHSPQSRCIYLGEPSKHITDTVSIIVEGLESVLNSVKPGKTLGELHKVWTTVIKKYNIEKDSRIGYPVGIGYPPTWGELTCSMASGDTTVLEEGMTFHCIPALWLEDYGLVVSESFVVTDTGAKSFGETERGLLIKRG